MKGENQLSCLFLVLIRISSLILAMFSCHPLTVHRIILFFILIKCRSADKRLYREVKLKKKCPDKDGQLKIHTLSGDGTRDKRFEAGEICRNFTPSGEICRHFSLCQSKNVKKFPHFGGKMQKCFPISGEKCRNVFLFWEKNVEIFRQFQGNMKKCFSILAVEDEEACS